MGRSGQPVQKPGGRACTLSSTSFAGSATALGSHQRNDLALARGLGLGLEPAVLLQEAAQALDDGGGVVFARERQHVLAVQGCSRSALAQDVGGVLLDEVGLAFLDDEHGALVAAETLPFGVDQRIRHVHHVERDLRLAEHVGQAELAERADHGVVAAALHGDADVVGIGREEFVELALLDELHRGRPALLDLLVLVLEARRRQHDAADVALGLLQRVLDREGRATVVGGDELAVHVAGAHAQLQHHGRVARLGELEAVLHSLHDAGQVRPRVEQPHLRLHRERMAALLHDRGAFAVVFADDDERPAGHAPGGQVGQRVGGHVGAHRGLEGHRAAQRIVDRCGERCRRGGLAGAVLEADAVLGQDVLRIGQHVHQVRDRRALVAGDIGDARLQQRLGHREDAFAAEHLAGAQAKLLDFFDK